MYSDVPSFNTCKSSTDYHNIVMYHATIMVNHVNPELVNMLIIMTDFYTGYSCIG